MRDSHISVLFCLFAVLGLSHALAADLKSHQETYGKSTERILQSHQPKFEGLKQQYRKSLEALKAKAQAAGDLQQALAAGNELERFLRAKSMPVVPDDGAATVIRAFQTDYLRQFNRLEQDMTAEQGMLALKYEQALERLQQELTKAGKIDDALAVKSERVKAQAETLNHADTLAALRAAATNGLAAAASPLSTLGSALMTPLYLVVDLSRGPKADIYPVSSLADVPKDGWTDQHKTDKLVLRHVEPGTFKRGSDTVTLTKGFYTGIFEVTQRQWELVTGTRPSQFKGFRDSDLRPVDRVSYDDIRGASAGALWPSSNSVDAASFLGLLRQKSGLATLDLPTEAQWEYACRAGTEGDHAGEPNSMAWHRKNSEKTTHPVGLKQANAWGLHDLHGNVWEWCLDWRSDYAEPMSDPKGAITGSARAIRGGSFFYSANQCSAVKRFSNKSSDSYCDGGLRVVLSPTQP